MTTTIKTKKAISHNYGTSLLLDILADGKRVGEAITTVCHGEDLKYLLEYAHLNCIDIDEAHRGKGYGTEAIELMRKFYGRIVTAPDSEDSRRYFERIGEPAVDTTGALAEAFLDVGFGVYEIY